MSAATSNGYADAVIVKELIQSGANAKMKNGKRVLDIAQERRPDLPNRKEIVELLKSSGAKERSDLWTEWTYKKLGYR